MPRCKFCQGFIMERYGEYQCVNCSREIDAPANSPVLFTISYKSHGFQNGIRYRDYDLERPNDKTSLAKVLDSCIGAGLQGVEINSRSFGLRSAIDKGSCRICGHQTFTDKRGRIVKHTPAEGLTKEIKAALELQGVIESKKQLG